MPGEVMEIAVQFRDAVAIAGSYPVLAGVELSVPRGQLVALHGPNGSGKTSLLRASAGLLAVTSGRAVVLGHDLVRERRAVRRRVGLLGHSSFLYDDLSVGENVRFALRSAGADPTLARGPLGVLGLDGRLARVAVGRLSAGQRRRVALAILIARDPDLWLLDEPHAGLDAAARGVLEEAARSAASRGAAVIVASHEHDRTAALASRTVTMRAGRVVAGTELAGVA